MPPHSRDVKSLWQNNRRHAPHLSRHFLLKVLVSSVGLHSRNALYKAARLQTLIEDDTVTFRSPYSMFFSVRMVVMFVGLGYLACRVAVIVSPPAFAVTLTCPKNTRTPWASCLRLSLFLWNSSLACWCLLIKNAFIHLSRRGQSLGCMQRVWFL